MASRRRQKHQRPVDWLPLPSQEPRHDRPQPTPQLPARRRPDRTDLGAGAGGGAGGATGSSDGSGQGRQSRRPAYFTDSHCGGNRGMTAWKAIGFTGAYTAPYGVRMGTCNLCGFCEGFGCRAFQGVAANDDTADPARAGQPRCGHRHRPALTCGAQLRLDHCAAVKALRPPLPAPPATAHRAAGWRRQHFRAGGPPMTCRE